MFGDHAKVIELFNLCYRKNPVFYCDYDFNVQVKFYCASTKGSMAPAAKFAKLSVYLSVLMGPLLIYQIYRIVPSYVFYSILIGWLLYLLTAIGIAKNIRYFYYAAIVLAALVLAVSIPQPEHYAFFSDGHTFAAITFLVGNLLQVVVIISSILTILRR